MVHVYFPNSILFTNTANKSGKVVVIMYYPNYFRQMTVTGNGSIAVEPDTSQIQLEVLTQNEILSQAQQENADTMNQVIQALLQLGIPEENIQTTGFNIHPMYDYIDGEQVFRGYEVVNTITVQIKEIDQTGVVIDTAVQNGVNRVSNIQFTIENEQIHYRQALSTALINASEKAQTIARTMQLQLDPIPIKIVEILNEPPVVYKTFAAAESNTTTPISPGQIQINAVVRVKFRY